MGDVNLEIKLSNLDERVIKIEESGGGSGGDGYITSVSNDFNVVNKKLSLSNDISTKLSKVDTTDNLSVELAKKIDKPASATDGQVLTYRNGSWVAENSSASITEPTDLEKGIIGGDAWTAKSYTAGSTVIYNNKIYSCIADCGASNLPTDTTYWEETSLSALNSKLKKARQLWSNPNPSSSFNAQTIELDLSSYTFVGILWRYDQSYGGDMKIVPIGAGINTLGAMNGGSFRSRDFTVTETGVIVDNCHLNGSSSQNDNVHNIPISVYGFNL